VQRLPGESPFEREASYVRAVRHHGFVAVSATAATGANGRALHPGDAFAQAADAIQRVLAAAAQLGARREDVVRTRVYLAPEADWREVVRAHGAAFAGAPPANTMVIVAGFVPPGVLVEVELDAVVGAPE
jgi:enamine deaminase RidA (YjgF/YER057c/UK114 family)